MIDVEIIVSDEGEGIKDNDLKDLFKPYFTDQSTGKISHGLGLCICKQIAQNLNGDLVYIPSERGCSFALKLKLQRPIIQENFSEELVFDPQ
jgi:signal transduction histidine kinase